MSPAKMFAYMKERERKTEEQEVPKVSSSTRDLFDEGENPKEPNAKIRPCMCAGIALVSFCSHVIFACCMMLIVLLMLSLASYFLGDFHQSRDTPPSTAHSMDEMEDAAFTSVPESAGPVNQSGSDSADSQSDTIPSEDVPIPAAPSQPVLLQDPLVLNTPRISIPKKNESFFKQNKWSQRLKFPTVSRNLFQNKCKLMIKRVNDRKRKIELFFLKSS